MEYETSADNTSKYFPACIGFANIPKEAVSNMKFNQLLPISYYCQKHVAAYALEFIYNENGCESKTAFFHFNYKKSQWKDCSNEILDESLLEKLLREPGVQIHAYYEYSEVSDGKPTLETRFLRPYEQEKHIKTFSDVESLLNRTYKTNTVLLPTSDFQWGFLQHLKQILQDKNIQIYKNFLKKPDTTLKPKDVCLCKFWENMPSDSHTSFFLSLEIMSKTPSMREKMAALAKESPELVSIYKKILGIIKETKNRNEFLNRTRYEIEKTVLVFYLNKIYQRLCEDSEEVFDMLYVKELTGPFFTTLIYDSPILENEFYRRKEYQVCEFTIDNLLIFHHKMKYETALDITNVLTLNIGNIEIPIKTLFQMNFNQLLPISQFTKKDTHAFALKFTYKNSRKELETYFVFFDHDHLDWRNCTNKIFDKKIVERITQMSEVQIDAFYEEQDRSQGKL